MWSTGGVVIRGTAEGTSRTTGGKPENTVHLTRHRAADNQRLSSVCSPRGGKRHSAVSCDVHEEQNL